jgi:hypothetical protein
MLARLDKACIPAAAKLDAVAVLNPVTADFQRLRLEPPFFLADIEILWTHRGKDVAGAMARAFGGDCLDTYRKVWVLCI